MRRHTPVTTVKTVAVAVGLFATGFGLGTAVIPTRLSAGPSPAYITPSADWLTTVNYYRTMAGVGPVVEDPSMSAGAVAHSCYMLYNGIAHDEVPGLTGYTPEGDAAGNSGNVAVSTQINTSARSHVELWMSGPFHAIGVIRPNLRSTGFGKCDLPDTPTWHSGATLDVIRGLDSSPRPATPILFPGNGTTTNLYRFVTESPDPLEFCGWNGQLAGLPLIAMMPEAATSPRATLNGPNGPIEVCVLSAANTTGVAQQILQGANAVVVVPRTALAPGTYTANVATTARTVPWSFTVDPAAATGLEPVPVAMATGAQTGYVPLPPVRIVDTRIGLGITALQAQTPTRVQVTGGVSGVPSTASAVQLNVTAIGASGPGFLTLWSSCSTPQPVVSTVNFAANAIVANAATIPLAGDGSLCVFSNVATDLLIGVRGYYSTSDRGRYEPVVPVRLIDSREGLGTPARLAGGQSIELSVVGGTAGVPQNATAVALNVTGVFPSADGFITAYPCGTMPGTSSLNPLEGRVIPNLVMARVSPVGTVCFFSNTAVDLVVDIVGYISTSAANEYTPSVPFRFTDTRDPSRPAINANQAGAPLVPSQTLRIPMAGVRGIPANAEAISANLTVVDAGATGFVTAYPCGGAIPTASNVNYEVGVAISTAAQLPLSADGAICIYTSSSAQVIVDVNGWWS